MKKALIITLVIGGLLTAGAVAVEKNDGATERRPLVRLIRAQIARARALRADLNLTDEQKQEIGLILLEYKDEIAKVAKPVVEAKRELRKAVWAEKIDEKAIRTASEELGKAIADAAVLAARIRAEAAEVLTAEQLKVIEKFHSDRDAAVDNFLEALSQAQ